MKLLFLLVILFIYFIYKVEGLSVNDYIYDVCPNKYNKMMNNYKLKKNDIRPLPVGFYSSILNEGGARDERRYLDSPICVKEHEFIEDYFINNVITDCPSYPGNCDSVGARDAKKLYKKNRLPLINPMDTYGVVGEDYGILYDKVEQGKFIELHHLNEEDIHERSNHHQSNF